MAKAKPKIARSTAARAKSGDVGARVELYFTWLSDIAQGKERLTFGQLFSLVGTLVAVGAVGAGAYMLLGSKVVALSPSDTAALKRVFFTGEPWLVECSTRGSASPMVYNAESSLRGVQIGTLDCGALLPSGKTTYERFKLTKPSYGPVLLAAANTERPQLAPRNALASETALATWVKGATKAKMFTPANGAQFESQCVRKPWCLVVLTATGRLVDAERKALQILAEKERRVRVVKIDASKSRLLLDLPGGELPAPSTTAATLVLLKEAEGSAAAEGETDESAEEGGISGKAVIAAHLPKGLSDPADTGSTILTALTSSEPVPLGFSMLQKRPVLREKRQPAPSKPTTVTPEPRTSKSEPASKTLTDAELKAMREERQRVIKEAELNRRAQMAEEEKSAANLIEEVPEGGDEAEGGADASAFAADDDDDDAPSAAEGDDEVEAVEFD